MKPPNVLLPNLYTVLCSGGVWLLPPFLDRDMLLSDELNVGGEDPSLLMCPVAAKK